jgi:hypothetical protein
MEVAKRWEGEKYIKNFSKNCRIYENEKPYNLESLSVRRASISLDFPEGADRIKSV